MNITTDGIFTEDMKTVSLVLPATMKPLLPVPSKLVKDGRLTKDYEIKMLADDWAKIQKLLQRGEFNNLPKYVLSSSRKESYILCRFLLAHSISRSPHYSYILVVC